MFTISQVNKELPVSELTGQERVVLFNRRDVLLSTANGVNSLPLADDVRGLLPADGMLMAVGTIDGAICCGTSAQLEDVDIPAGLSVKPTRTAFAESGPDPCWAITAAASKAHAVSSHRKTAPFPCSPSRLDDLLSLLRLAPRQAGEHVAVIGNDGQYVTARDISRHYALDAAVGKALEAEMDLTGCIFCTSGRISLEVVRKAARVSIPVLCTEKAVGSLAADFSASEGIAIYCPGMTPAWYGDPQRFPAHST